VFAAVKQDLLFTYVLAGAEGSINDAQLAAQAFSRSFHIGPNRYYFADAGFASQQGVQIPFANVRYHLQDWELSLRPPETAKELYNLRHARLRGVVERAFGRVKRTWKIIREASPEYGISQ